MNTNETKANYEKKLAREAFEQQKWELAVKHYEAAMALYPFADATDYQQLGASLCHLKRHHQAVKPLTEAILLDNTNGISYYFRGNAHNKRNVNDAIGIAYEAIADCTCAINLGITGSYLREAYIERSSAFSTAKCFEAAVSDAQLAIKTDTGHLLTHIRWNLGTYLETLGRYNAAIAAYQDAKHHYKSEGDRSDCDQKITKMQADIEALTKKKEQIQNEFQKVTIQHQNELAAAERGLLKHNLFLLISPNEKC